MHFYSIDLSLKLFTVVGINPERGGTASHVLFWFFIVINIFMGVLLSLQFVYSEQPPTVMVVADFISCVFILFHGMMKATAMFIKRDKVLDLLTTINTKFWNYEDDNYSKKIGCHQMLHDVKKIVNIYLTMYIINLSFFALVPVFSKGEVLIYESYRPPWIPYPILLFLEQLTGILCTLFTTIPVDFLFMSVLTLTRVQYKLLNEELRHLFDRTEDNNSRTNALRHRIRACAEHHAFLNDFIKRINETFSLTLFLFHLIVLISMCMEMYRASSVSEWKVLIKPMGYTMAGLFAFVICYCAYSQMLVDEASNVSLNAYFSDWTNSCTAASPLMMIISSAQKEITITAGGITNIDLKCGLDTVNSIISYFMFLRTMSSTGSESQTF